MVRYDNNDIMRDFFSGRIKDTAPPKPKMVELGNGKGIGHDKGSYSQFVMALRTQGVKGNGVISIGKSVVEDKDRFSMQNPTDKFTTGDVPHLLIKYDNIIKDISLSVKWKDSDGDTILEQFYKVPTAYSIGKDWWDSYDVYFMGPDKLDEGDYSVEVRSQEVLTREEFLGDKKDNMKILTAVLDFTVEDSSG